MERAFVLAVGKSFCNQFSMQQLARKIFFSHSNYSSLLAAANNWFNQSLLLVHYLQINLRKSDPELQTNWLIRIRATRLKTNCLWMKTG